jgi:hypothetical protein
VLGVRSLCTAPQLLGATRGIAIVRCLGLIRRTVTNLLKRIHCVTP